MDFNFNSAERQPPQSIEAEISILGGILLDPLAITRIADLLQPEDFYVDGHKKIYQILCTLHEAGKPTDLLHVTEWLSDAGLLAQIGGRNKLVSLVQSTVSAVNIDSLADLVRQKRLQRELIRTFNTGLEMVYAASNAAPDNKAQIITEALENKLMTLRELQPTQKTGSSIASLLPSVFSDIEERHRGLALPGIPSGFYDLDAMTGGFQLSDLILLAARPAMGKTSLAMNAAFNAASLYKTPVLIFSLEMSREQLIKRLLASEAGIELGYLRSGRISGSQWGPLTQAIHRLSDLPIHIEDDPNISVSCIRSKLRQHQASGQEIGMVIIDYLQLMEGISEENRAVGLGKISRGLKVLAREFNIPIIALSQLSRSVEARTNKRPLLSDLRESGALEQDADLVLMLYRDDYYNNDSPDRGIAEVIVAKHRNGPTGTVKLLFDAQFTKFKNLSKPEVY